MDRMCFAHHKMALTITILAVAIFGVFLGMNVYSASENLAPIIVLQFSLMMVMLVLMFIQLSFTLRLREEFFSQSSDSSSKKASSKLDIPSVSSASANRDSRKKTSKKTSSRGKKR